LRQHLLKALEKRTCAWNRSKIMIVGPGRAGKTALTMSILGEPFQKDLKSTIGINELTCDVKFTGLSTDGQWEKYSAPKKLFEEALAKEIYREHIITKNNRSKESSNGVSAAGSLHNKSFSRSFSAATKKNSSSSTSGMNKAVLGKKLSFKKSWSRMSPSLAATNEFVLPSPILIHPPKGKNLPSSSSRSLFPFPDEDKELEDDGMNHSDDSENEEHDHNKGRPVLVHKFSTDDQQQISFPLPNSFSSLSSSNPSVNEVDSTVVMECLSKGIHLFDSKFIFSLYDFGGQSIFDVIHPFFLTRQGVYLIVFNMNDFFTSEERQTAALENLKFWINSVAIHSFDKEINEMAPMLFIGTRKDVIYNPLQHEYISNQLFYYFHNHNSWPFVVPNSTGEGSTGSTNLFFFPVNNKLGKKDPVISKLMISIEEIVSESNYIQEEIPFSWLQLIDVLKEMNKSFLTYQDLIEVTVESGCALKEKELKPFLTFCNEMSILMWNNDEMLKNIIILDPIEYFVKPATIIICKHSIAKPHQHQAGGSVSDSTLHLTPIHKKSMKHFFEDWQCMIKYGIITEALVKALLHHYDYKENIIYLMCKYGLLLPLYSILKAKSFHLMNNNRTYLVPSLLPELPVFFGASGSSYAHDNGDNHRSGSPVLDSHKEENETKKKTLSFYFGFHLSSILKSKTMITLSMMKEYGFLPNGFFERLLCKIIPCCYEDEISLEDKNISESIFKNAVILTYKGQEFHLFHLSTENLLKVEIVHGLNPIPIYLMLQKNLLSICKESYLNLSIIALLEFSCLNHSMQYQNKMKSLSVRNNSIAKQQELERQKRREHFFTSTSQEENEKPVDITGNDEETTKMKSGYSEEDEKILIKLSTIEKCLQHNRDLEVSLLELQNSVYFSQHCHRQYNNSFASESVSSSVASFSASMTMGSSLTPRQQSNQQFSNTFSHLKEKFSLSMLKTEYNLWLYQFKQRLMLTNYDIFLSYRWNQRDSELVKSLFQHFLSYNISNHVYSPISVFLDHQRIESGEEFREIFVSALLKSRIIIPVITLEALKGFISHNPNSIDNLLLEWIISLVCYYGDDDNGYNDLQESPQYESDQSTTRKRRKIIPIMMGNYEMKETTKEIVKLTKINDLQDFEITLYHQNASSPNNNKIQEKERKEYFKHENILSILSKTSNLVPVETMKCAEKLLKQNNIPFLDEIKSLTVHKIIEKLLLFNGIVVTNQLYQLPMKLERLTKEYSEKIMESLYSIYSSFEESFVDSTPDNNLKANNGSNKEKSFPKDYQSSKILIRKNAAEKEPEVQYEKKALKKKLTKANLYSSSYYNLLCASADCLDEPPPPLASFSFSRDETDYEDISEYQKNIDHHIHSILSLRDSQSWNDFYFYDNMTMMTTNTTTSNSGGSNGSQLMKNPSSRNSLRFKLKSNNNQRAAAEKKPLPPPPPLSINKMI
jgi:GTPase SAR1 family protein